MYSIVTDEEYVVSAGKCYVAATAVPDGGVKVENREGDNIIAVPIDRDDAEDLHWWLSELLHGVPGELPCALG